MRAMTSSSVSARDIADAATYASVLAMQDALKKDSRVHRDISAGNIILVREHEGQTVRKGYLIDWESSCTVDESGLAVKAGRAVLVLLDVSHVLLTFVIGHMALYVESYAP